MFRSLSPGAIGASVENLADGLDLAARHGFAGYHFSIGEVAAMGAEEALALVERKTARQARLVAELVALDFVDEWTGRFTEKSEHPPRSV